MRKKFAVPILPTSNYIKKNKSKQTSGIPAVKVYNLSQNKGLNSFKKALTNLSGKKSHNLQSILREVLDSRVFVDEFELYLKDLYKINRPDGITEDEYILQNNTWSNSNIVEYPWKTKGKFVRVPKEDDFFKTIFSRQEFIFASSLRLSQEKREKLRNGKIKIAGLGVGGVIGYLLVLSGAQNIDVVDGGVLPPHKFNRFIGADVSMVGESYVTVWGRAVLNLNPYLHLSLFNKNLGIKDGHSTISVKKFLVNADVIIEEVDSFPIKDELRRVGKKLGKYVIMASDVGEKSVIDIQRPGDPIWNNLSKADKRKVKNFSLDFKEVTKLAIKVIGINHIPIRQFINVLKSGQTYWPQDGGTAFLSALGVRDIIVDVLCGEKDIWIKTSIERKKEAWRPIAISLKTAKLLWAWFLQLFY